MVDTSSRTEPRQHLAAWAEDLVRSAAARIPFYRDHLAHADPSDFAALPSFDKHMTAGYGRFPISAGGATGSHRILATSGTTGERLFVAFDEPEWGRLGPWMEAIGHQTGLTATDVFLNTHCYGLWVGGPALDVLADRARASLVQLGPTDPVVVLKLLADGVGTAISATPSYLRRLVEAVDATGVDLGGTGLRLGFIGAEMAESSLRSGVVSRLPREFRWVELYGLTETGGPAVAVGVDPAVPELAVNTDAFLVEVLDPHADAAVPFGEVGELTITTRMLDGRTPLIRYRTRDLVRATGGDSSTASRISRILGRVDDSLKVGGVLVYHTAVAEIVTDVLATDAEWRAVLVRHGFDDELQIEAEAGAEACRAVEQAFEERVGLAVTAVSVPEGQLARSRWKTQRVFVESEMPEPGG